jgi:hypothetical protein
MTGGGMMGRGATGDAGVGWTEAQADRDRRIMTIRPGRELCGTTRVGGISQQWAVAQQEVKLDGEQTNGELGRQS